MKVFKALNFLTAGGLLLSGLMSPVAMAAEACRTLLLETGSKPVEASPKAPSAVINKAVVEKLLKAQLQAQILAYAGVILKAPLTPEMMAAKKISPLLLKDLSETGLVQQEKAVLKTLGAMSDQGQLQPMIVKLIAQLKTKADQVPELAPLKNLSPEKEQFVLATVMLNLEGLLSLHGMTAKTQHVKYTEWPALSATMKSRLDQSPAGIENVLHFANAKESSVRELKLLVDGPESFAMRDKLMAEATKSIDVMSWAIYSDRTGNEAARTLIKKHKEGVKVRVIVDGQVASRPGYTEAVARLEKAGVPVIRWTSATHPFAGQHRKMMIIDGEHMIAGGLNFGDVYSHKNPRAPKWRDTDVYVRGEAVNEGLGLFAKIWNDQITEKNLQLEKITDTKNAVEPREQDGEKVVILEHNPITDNQGSTIMMTLLKGIREAKENVDIENAYIVLFPELKSEIAAAVARGVKVRVFTNSHLSVDEPIISIPILRSARELKEIGADVYLRLGTTLHSKLVVIDSQYTMVMSYNLHPRSERIEGEMAVVVKGKAFAESVRQTIDKDVEPGKAFRVNSPEEIQLPENPVALPTLRIFFDML